MSFIKSAFPEIYEDGDHELECLECGETFILNTMVLDHNNVVLISDSPTTDQIRDWTLLAERYDKPISLRNVEPVVAVQCKKELLDLARLKLLKIFHCPIQSNDPDLLKVMGRDVKSTMEYA